MKKGFYIVILLILAFFTARGQNLVPNPSFEDSIVCQVNAGTYRPALWYSPTSGTPDYFSPSSPGNMGCYDDSPSRWGGGAYTNNWGYQLPHSGKAYAGFGLTQGAEYLSIMLTDSLKAGKLYCINSYVSLSNWSRSGIDLLEFAVTINPLTKYDTVNWNYLPLDTVIPNAGNNAGFFLIDTLNWVLINDTFIAQGGERFLTIGNFRVSETQYYLIDSINPSIAAYYYIDDVSILYCDEPEDTNHPEPPFTEILLNPNPSNGELLLTGNFEQETKFEVYDMLGQIVFEKYISPGNKTEQLSLLLADGIYTYRIVANGNSLKSGKILIQQ